MGLKKITSKKLENGDTFVTRIEDKKSKYCGQYLIFICFKDEFWLNYWPKNWYDESHSTLFRIKITTNKTIPITKEEIDRLEYVISKVKCIERAYFPFMSRMTYEELVESRSFQELHPDEYGYLNEYLNDIYYSREDIVPNFEYLGNFDVEKPKNEFISFGCDTHISSFPRIIADTLKHYDDYNKREDKSHYSQEEVEENHKAAKEFLELQIKIDNYIRDLTDKEKKNFQPKYISGWGTGLYDCDVALDTKAEYLEVYDVKKSVPDIMNQVLPRVKDFIKDQYDGPIAWMVLADLQMKRKKLDKRLRDTALNCIEIDLSYWQGNEQYEERKKELCRLKKRLENSKIVRKKPKKKESSKLD